MAMGQADELLQVGCFSDAVPDVADRRGVRADGAFNLFQRIGRLIIERDKLGSGQAYRMIIVKRPGRRINDLVTLAVGNIRQLVHDLGRISREAGCRCQGQRGTGTTGDDAGFGRGTLLNQLACCRQQIVQFDELSTRGRHRRDHIGMGAATGDASGIADRIHDGRDAEMRIDITLHRDAFEKRRERDW